MQAGAIITFAPYAPTNQAYKDLQSCVTQSNANINFVIFQTYSVPADPPNTLLARQQAALTGAQASERCSIVSTSFLQQFSTTAASLSC